MRYSPSRPSRLLPALPPCALLGALLGTVALLSACGGSGGDAGADPAKAVPAKAPLYVIATVRPEGAQKANAERVAKALLDTADPGGTIARALERSPDGPDGLDFGKDVEPWLGDRVAIALPPVSAASGKPAPDALLVVASRDNGRARDALARSKELPESGEHRGIELRRSKRGDSAGAVIEDESLVVFGSLDAVRQAIDAVEDGRALEDSESFERAQDRVPDEGIAHGYADVGALVADAARAGGRPDVVQLLRSLAGEGAQTVAFALTADVDGLRLRSAATGGPRGDGDAQAQASAADALAALPAGAWLGAAAGDVGGSVEQALAQAAGGGGLGKVGVDALLAQLRAATGLDLRRDLLSWMGNGAIFLEGTGLGDLGGGLVVDAQRPARMRAAVHRLERVLPRLVKGSSVRRLAISGVDRGVSISGGDLPVRLYLAAAGDRFVLAVGKRALRSALKPDGRLGDSAGFESIAPRLGDGQRPSLYVDLGQVADLIENLGAGDPEAVRTAGVLRRMTQAAGGGGRRGDARSQTLVVGVRGS